MAKKAVFASGLVNKVRGLAEPVSRTNPERQQPRMRGGRTATRGALPEGRTHLFEMVVGVLVGLEHFFRRAQQPTVIAQFAERTRLALGCFWTAVRFMPLTDSFDVGQELDGVFAVAVKKVFAGGEFLERHGGV